MRFVQGRKTMTGHIPGPLAAVALVLVFSGCSAYDLKPLDRASVDRALKPPAMEAVKVSAAQIKHPLLAPIVIDGRGGYTPDEIAVIVVIVSPEMRALRDQRGVAKAQVVAGGHPPQPAAWLLGRPAAWDVRSRCCFGGKPRAELGGDVSPDPPDSSSARRGQAPSPSTCPLPGRSGRPPRTPDFAPIASFPSDAGCCLRSRSRKAWRTRSR